MIESLRLKNYQSHKDSELVFSPGVNVIIGQSDCGKTAFFRAIRWLIWNRPLGNSFRSHWGGRTSVAVSIDGTEIERWKDTDQGYIIGGKVLKAIRSDVPDEVKDLFNIDEVNLQSQFDRPFLLDGSAGEVAQHFNRVAHLDSIDSTNGNLLSLKTYQNQTLRSLEESLEENKKNLAKFKDLNSLEALILEAEKFQKEVEDKFLQVQDLEGKIGKMEVGERLLAEYEKKISLNGRIEGCLEEIAKRDILVSQKSDLDTLIQRYKDNEKNITFVDALIPLEVSIEGLTTLRTEVTHLAGQRSAILSLLDQLEDNKKGLDSVNKIIAFQEDEFKANFPDICPLCGKEMDKDD